MICLPYVNDVAVMTTSPRRGYFFSSENISIHINNSYTRALVDPDPPSRCHLLCCFRSLLPAKYYSYASVVAPQRLTSNTFMVPRVRPKSSISVDNERIWWWILVWCADWHLDTLLTYSPLINTDQTYKFFNPEFFGVQKVVIWCPGCQYSREERSSGRWNR